MEKRNVQEEAWWASYEKHTGKPYSLIALAAGSFIDAWLFFFPPEIILSALVLARPKRWLFYTLFATFFTILGSYVGYIIGAFFFETFGTVIFSLLGEEEAILEQARLLYQDNAFWTLVLTGITPIPFVPFVMAAGFFKVNIFLFTVAVFFARFFRYGPIALLVALLGQRGVCFVSRALRASTYVGVFLAGLVLLGGAVLLVHVFY